ncbi:hypothetical protein [Numidum massiliense]|uniref:hypothetical protein n=1 Tax=Numidum massiliense TaxID=1522315 RepID=UPI0006D59419|nr:hypothetical protein [Numidum massiliense]
MNQETLPDAFWIGYYLFLFLTFALSVGCIMRGKLSSLSFGNLFACLTVPTVGFFGALGRPEGTEWDWLVQEVIHFEWWALYVCAATFYIFYWWYKFIFSKT